ncbi:MAG: methyl-accepting chemotaxis protein [Clostridia bacterium]|nr:methyl-accepting chemotaxis protein [Clostridia bacterium]
MQWFRNLKIKAKLLTCFIVVALFTGLVGAIGISNMYTINSRADSMYNENFVPVRELSVVEKNLQLIRVNYYLMLYEEDISKYQQRLDEINAWSQQNDEILTRFGESFQSKDEEDLYNEVEKALVPYKEIRTSQLNLIRAGKYAEAKVGTPEFAKARADVDNALGKLIDYNIKYAKDSSEKNATDFRSQSILMAVIIVIAVALAIGLGLIVANIICKPLSQLLGAANKIAKGDLDVSVDINARDEVGALAQAFRTMTDNMNDVMFNINSAAEQVASGSRQVSDSSMALSQGATEQASSIQQLTASLEEISSQTRQNADNATQANEFAEAAKVNATQGNDQMRQMLKAMDEINDSSSNISKIIKVIDEIAFQTNILALNAAVEAARAGQHGKGFAVVAEEVRNLAARSANAAKETTAMIEGSIKKVEGGTKIANETAEALNKIVVGVGKVAALVSDIAAASNEQAAGIAQINQGIAQVSEVVQANSATSEETAAASEELSSQAEMLKDQVSRFKLRRNSHSFSYRGLEGVNPDVLRMLENMSDKRKMSAYKLSEEYGEAAATNSKAKIALSDNEFGKY